MNTNRTIEVNDFIRIARWKTEGMVIATRPASLGTDEAQEVLIERKPDDPSPRWYRLEPHEFQFEHESTR